MNTTRKLSVVGLVLGSVLASIPSTNAQTLPAPPQAYVDTTYPVQTGVIIPVSSGGDFQAALNAAQPGDTISLAAGASFVGNYSLPVKNGSGWFIVRSSAPDNSLPPQGMRITPASAAQLPKIVSPNSSPALQTVTGTPPFRVVAVEFTIASGVTQNYALVALGDGSIAQNLLSQVPHDLIFDRVYLHGNATANLRRAFALNSAWTAIIDSA